MTTTTAPDLPRIERSTEDALVLSGVRRSYPITTKLNWLTGRREATASFEAVRGIDLRVARGELFALLGTNGAGKTSTVELIEGLARPSGGTIEVLGHDPFAERKQVRHHTGVVLQQSGFPPTLTVREMAQIWQGTLTRSLAVDETLAAVDLADKLEVETAKLSGGERRRLDIALAVLGNPELLVLDEPTTGLDPESRRHIWSLIQGLVQRGSTVLLTTHYLEEAENLADRIAIMHDGLIAREGTLADIVAEAPARISFLRPECLALADLYLPDTTITLTDRMVIETRTLQDTLARVLAWAGTTPLPQLEARSASLEQVFLSIADTEEL
ncbi:ABC transporter ATP-binding protein [Granulicoccus sp. GXG6511]|uniref:ABC transporter ATP-binding protein n=1 Tax=Granulicoccus sp. GXG6511 TaxID=3381351 RepID=UPI003D7EDE9C